MEPAQHGVQDVLNISTEVYVFHRTRLNLDHARLEKDHARLEKDHARLDLDHARLDVDLARLNKDHARHDLDHARLDLGVPEVSFAFSDHIQHPAKVILHILGFFSWYQSHFGWGSGGREALLAEEKPSLRTVKADLLNFDCLSSFESVERTLSDHLKIKQRKRQNRSNDEKRIRSGDCPFTKAKRSNRDVSDQNELQTYASLEKMLHKVIHVVRQLKKKGNTNTSSAPKQQNLRTNLFEEEENDVPQSKDQSIGATQHGS
uniref:Uncharacterized protein n=1 Tax=Brassica oleracea var. oleracea TaxID=109376 RepID=A0A0D3BUA7_BRAOL